MTRYCTFESHLSAILLLSGDQPQILRDVRKELLNTHKSFLYYILMMDTLEVVESFRQNIKKIFLNS